MELTGLDGKAAVVTGAGGGMGLAIARALLSSGCEVAMIDLKEAPSGLPATASYWQGDITDEAFVARVVDATARAAGRLDFVVNAAGALWFGKDKSVLEDDFDFDVWDRVLDINLKSVAFTARHAVPHMQRSGGGAMVHFSSTQALRGDDKPQDAYQSAKAAILALSKTFAVRLGPAIRSNVLIPGPAETPMQDRWNADPEMKRRTGEATPLGRVATAEDMVGPCLFLLSEQAAYITGTHLLVDGGRSAMPQ